VGLVAIVEDDAATRESLVSLLRASGYTTTAFGSAEEFLQSFTLTLVTGVLSVAQRGLFTYVLALVCAEAIAIRWMEWVVPGSMLVPVRQVATFLAVVLLGAIVSKGVFASGRVSLNRMMGAIVLYLLLGIGFAIAYDTIALYVPHAFAGAFEGTPGFERWAYFSFVTLTTVGYGDITPVATVARSVATFEAFVGQLYPAVILARLVSLQIAPPTGQSLERASNPRPAGTGINSNTQLSAYYSVVRPDFAANWQIRAQLQLMFPK